jgi:hypothetical protein
MPERSSIFSTVLAEASAQRAMAIHWKKSPDTGEPPPKVVEVVNRRCKVCEWEGESIESRGADPDCPWCHGPTDLVAAEPSTGAPPSPKNPHAAALGRLGGLKGGRARAEALTASERRRIATRAARARWGNKGSRKKKS